MLKYRKKLSFKMKKPLSSIYGSNSEVFTEMFIHLFPRNPYYLLKSKDYNRL